MNFVTVSEKNWDQVKLKALKVTPRYVNTTLAGVEFEDADGNTLIVERDGYSDMRVMLPKKPKVTRYRVTAAHPALGVLDFLYEAEDKAIEAKLALEGVDSIKDLNLKEVELDADQVSEKQVHHG